MPFCILLESFIKDKGLLSLGVKMGRIKTAMIKRVTNKLVKQHRDEFKKDFEENKKLVANFADIKSKKLRNIIAGYVTRQVKAKANQ
jgi:small subunit ribosomal protein S17e